MRFSEAYCLEIRANARDQHETLARIAALICTPEMMKPLDVLRGLRYSSKGALSAISLYYGATQTSVSYTVEK